MTLRTKMTATEWSDILRDDLSRVCRVHDVGKVVRGVAEFAIQHDKGQLLNAAASPGYAYIPRPDMINEYEQVEDRQARACATIGRVLAGEKCDHRSYLALMEGVADYVAHMDDSEVKLVVDDEPDPAAEERWRQVVASSDSVFADVPRPIVLDDTPRPVSVEVTPKVAKALIDMTWQEYLEESEHEETPISLTDFGVYVTNVFGEQH